jgi:hypothetical protein
MELLAAGIGKEVYYITRPPSQENRSLFQFTPKNPFEISSREKEKKHVKV